MTDHTSLRDHLLIAMPALSDPHFDHSVTYICEHSEEGAMGILINRQLTLTMAEVLEQMKIQPSSSFDTTLQVHEGGPVQTEHGFVLHTPVGAWESSLQVNEAIALTTSRDILTAIAHGEGPQQYLIALGYAGWGPGQLERELSDNAWLSCPAEPRLLFDLPIEERWAAAAALLGVDLNLLSSEVGHA
ncbi:MAG: YqgE/AlgH family protein [Gammaproteobacteria bacterium]|nr:YqgE/AlgH family protein [Gammaproteobacteria bacterium]